MPLKCFLVKGHCFVRWWLHSRVCQGISLICTAPIAEPILENEVLHGQHFREERGRGRTKEIFIHMAMRWTAWLARVMLVHFKILPDREHISKPLHLFLGISFWLTWAPSNMMQWWMQMLCESPEQLVTAKCKQTSKKTNLHVQTYSIEILQARGTKTFSNFPCCNHTRHRMAIANGFSHGDNVRHKVFTLQLESPEMLPNSAKANLDLISYEYTTCCTHIPGNK